MRFARTLVGHDTLVISSLFIEQGHLLLVTR
jgi:hypothetical protein